MQDRCRRPADGHESWPGATLVRSALVPAQWSVGPLAYRFVTQVLRTSTTIPALYVMWSGVQRRKDFRAFREAGPPSCYRGRIAINSSSKMRVALGPTSGLGDLSP